MATFLTLGQVTFANFEIPENINFGGSQALSVKQLVGGKRIIDAMGRVDDDITWSGLLFTSTASFRALFLDNLRISGAPTVLTFGLFSFSVVVKEFKASFERFYQIPYSITVTVIENLNNPVNVLFPVGYNDAILNMLTELNDLAVLISAANVTSAMLVLTTLINAIPSLSGASSLVLIPILDQIAIVQSAVATALITVNGSVFS